MNRPNDQAKYQPNAQKYQPNLQGSPKRILYQPPRRSSFSRDQGSGPRSASFGAPQDTRTIYDSSHPNVEKFIPLVLSPISLQIICLKLFDVAIQSQRCLILQIGHAHRNGRQVVDPELTLSRHLLFITKKGDHQSPNCLPGQTNHHFSHSDRLACSPSRLYLKERDFPILLRPHTTARSVHFRGMGDLGVPICAKTPDFQLIVQVLVHLLGSLCSMQTRPDTQLYIAPFLNLENLGGLQHFHTTLILHLPSSIKHIKKIQRNTFLLLDSVLSSESDLATSENDQDLTLQSSQVPCVVGGQTRSKGLALKLKRRYKTHWKH